MSILTYTYQFSSATTEPPTGSQIRFDADVATGVQKIWVRYLTTDGVDAYYALMASVAGWTVWVQDKDDHTKGARYTQTGPALDKGGYVELPVVIDMDLAPLLSQQVVLGLQSVEAATPPEPPGPEPPPSGGGIYATLDDVQRRMPQFILTTTSKPNLDTAQVLLDDTHADYESQMSNLGYIIPITGDLSVKQSREIVCQGTIWRILCARGAAIGTEAAFLSADRAKEKYEHALDLLADEDKPNSLSDAPTTEDFAEKLVGLGPMGEGDDPRITMDSKF